MKKSACLVLVACFAVSLPLPAEETDGLSVEIDLNFLSAKNLGAEYVVVDPDLDFQTEGTIASPEFSSEFSPEIRVGYALDGHSGLSLRYWSFDEDASDEQTSGVDGLLWDSLFHPTWSLDGFIGTASAGLNIEAESLDLSYYRRVSGDGRTDLTIELGARWVKAERDLRVLYDDGFDPERVRLQSESDGIGLTVGASGSVRLCERWSMVGQGSMGFLSGNVESSNRSLFESDPSDLITDVTREEDRTFRTIDLSVGAVWQATERLRVGLGYRFRQWIDVVDQDKFPDDVNAGTLQHESLDLSWDGPSLSLGMTF